MTLVFVECPLINMGRDTGKEVSMREAMPPNIFQKNDSFISIFISYFSLI